METLSRETLTWEKHDNALFNIFIRDLSMGLNTNLKHMILDNNNDESKIKLKKPKLMKKKI